ncbi:hypothetical protein QAD02_019780 [Eretmocerus hayati]|uniref:Uncharacterized protein n=1 Tax=Eretmocerus hayati TaxID=131215 RepID=A0ACC2PLM7_9HYME|nr:hypothetical protein QAD02_019780 [Eretmocerus hayati]
MGSVGYTGIRASEVLHVIECRMVDVAWDDSTIRCYDELPVLYDNKSFYMTPRTRVLKKHRTERLCSSDNGGGYQFDKVWYIFSPDRQAIIPPAEIQTGQIQE